MTTGWPQYALPGLLGACIALVGPTARAVDPEGMGRPNLRAVHRVGACFRTAAVRLVAGGR